MQPESKQLQLLSEDVQEIISYRPHWFIRRGNIIFLGIITFLLALSFIIQYPDIVKASARVTAVNAPVMLESKKGGELEKLIIKDAENVSAGQVLAYIQSTGRHGEIISLQEWINDAEININNGQVAELLKQPLTLFTGLGELQPAYQDFQNIFLATKEVLADGYYQKKKKALQKDLYFLAELKNNTVGQQQLIQQDQLLQQKEFEAYEKLAREKVIAPLELNQYKSKLISKEQSIKQNESQITNSDVSSHNKRKEILDLEKAVVDQVQQFRSAIFTLKSRVEEWIQQYVITAPVNGRLEFISSLQEKQLLNAGQSLFYVQPPHTSYYAEMKAGQTGFGKIKTGQKVMLKLLGYPEAEFGFIEGRISFISNLPNERDSFLIRVDLSKGLVTNYERKIVFRNGLSAVADIVTEERKLADRFFGEVKKMMKR